MSRRLTVNNVEVGGSSSGDIERRKFVRKCPMNECKGYLSSQWKCGTCETKICNKCNEHKDDDHECLPENVASMDLLNKDTKPCPKCGTMICKISGCDQMWCPECHSAFSWNKGTIEVGIVHNPHYYDFMRKNNGGAIPRNPGDVVCGGIPDFYQLRNIFETTKFNIANRDYYYTIHRTIAHVQQVEIPHLHLNRDYNAINRNLRVKYLMNKISEDEFKTTLQQDEKKRERAVAFANIYQMFVDVGSDIFRQIVNSYATDRSPVVMCPILYEQLVVIRNLVEYFNANITKVGKNFKCVYPAIISNGAWISNIVTHNARIRQEAEHNRLREAAQAARDQVRNAQAASNTI
jgi:hypothetical protein